MKTAGASPAFLSTFTTITFSRSIFQLSSTAPLDDFIAHAYAALHKRREMFAA